MLDAAARQLPGRAVVTNALAELRSLGAHARATHPRIRVGFDLADSSGYAYYSGARFAVYAKGASDAIARGGRYDEVGAVFGRNRPAVGFSLDVKDLAMLVGATGRPRADPRAVATGTRSCALRCASCAHGARSSSSSCPATPATNPRRRAELVAGDGRWAVAAR